MTDKKKTLLHLYLLENLGSPMQFTCECGETHSVLLQDFDLEKTEIEPKKLVRLKCVYHYEKLEEILKCSTELKIHAEFKNTWQKIFGGILIKYITWKFNKKTEKGTL
ncbi:hypothetical protein [Pseudomonas orientalis]|uniref:Uncharacterized protein n=1 Tax=Pseudomonas orientalis TaxID=76758 RepID=A0A2L0RYX3_9PSED|nr:hypothetical protein [Pseudomonas orientalis]AUZ47259.1 hypothetical protein BOP93_17240 [Pseudomonas orientalis]